MLDNSFIPRLTIVIIDSPAIDMAADHSIIKNSVGQLQGLILFWTCRHCEKSNIEPLVRKEATFGEKFSTCANCRGDSYVIFSPSKKMSEREKIVQQAMSFIPSHQHKEILEDLAWVEALFFIEDTEDLAKSYWNNLKEEIDYWVQQDSRQKNDSDLKR